MLFGEKQQVEILDHVYLISHEFKHTWVYYNVAPRHFGEELWVETIKDMYIIYHELMPHAPELIHKRDLSKPKLVMRFLFYKL